jgi:hypothetical protein
MIKRMTKQVLTKPLQIVCLLLITLLILCSPSCKSFAETDNIIKHTINGVAGVWMPDSTYVDTVNMLMYWKEKALHAEDTIIKLNVAHKSERDEWSAYVEKLNNRISLDDLRISFTDEALKEKERKLRIYELELSIYRPISFIAVGYWISKGLD